MGYALNLPDGVEAAKKRVEALIAKNAEKRAALEAQGHHMSPEDIQAQAEEEKKAEEERLEAERVEAERIESERLAAEGQELVPKKDLDDALHRISVLQGKLEGEPAELARQNSFLRKQIEALQNDFADLARQIKAKPEEVRDPTFREIVKDDPGLQKMSENFSPEIMEGMISYGERIYNLAQERAGKKAQEMVSDVASKVDGRLAKSAEDRFWEALYAAYPDFDQVWQSPELQAYGNEVDDTFGVPRFAAILTKTEKGGIIFNTLDAPKVIRWLDKATGKKSSSAKPGDGDPNLEDPKIKNRIGGPKSSGRSFQPSPGAELTVGQAKEQLLALREKKNTGHWKGTQEEFDKEFMRLSTILRKGSPATPGT